MKGRQYLLGHSPRNALRMGANFTDQAILRLSQARFHAPVSP